MRLSKQFLLMFLVFATLNTFAQSNLNKTTSVKSNSEQSQTWPSRQYSFLVTIGTMKAYFQEATGLDTETKTVENKKESSKAFSTIKMPGIKKFTDITLKKGVFKADSKFWEWVKSIKTNTCEHKTGTISILDESGNVVTTWTIKNAWPSVISMGNVKPDATDVTVESLVIVHEGLTLNK